MQKNRTAHSISHVRRLISNKITQTAPPPVVEESSQQQFDYSALLPRTVVECLYMNGKYYNAELESKDGQGMWTVKWADGDSQDKNNHPTSHFKRVISAPPQHNQKLLIGSKVWCFYVPNSKYYECTLMSMDNLGNYTVQWNDGDAKNTTGHPITHIKQIISAPQVKNRTLVPGAYVSCLYVPTNNHYRAYLVKQDKIHGLWEVQWEDGDSKNKVGHPAQHIHTIFSMPAQPEKSLETCFKCSAPKASDDAKFCGKCGSSFFCRQCSKKRVSKANFCDNCGNSFIDKTAITPTPRIMPMNSSAISPPPPAYAPPPAQNYGPPGFHDQFEGFGGAMVPGAPPSYEQVEGFTVSGSHASAPAPPSYEQFRGGQGEGEN